MKIKQRNLNTFNYVCPWFDNTDVGTKESKVTNRKGNTGNKLAGRKFFLERNTVGESLNANRTKK